MTRNSGLNIPGIYEIVHIESGKLYGGQAINIRKRWIAHRYALNHNNHRNRYLQNAWNKYGEAAFQFRVIEDFSYLADDELRKALDNAEFQWLMKNQSNSYNLMMATERGISGSQELKEWFSEFHSALWKDEEHRKARILAITRGINKEDAKKRRGDAIKAAKNKPEVKKAISEQMIQMWKNEDHQLAQSVKMKAKWQDQNYIEKQSKSRKAAWTDPQVRAKRIAGIKAAWAKRRDGN